MRTITYRGGQKSVGTFPVILVKLATSPLPPQTILNFEQNGWDVTLLEGVEDEGWTQSRSIKLAIGVVLCYNYLEEFFSCCREQGLYDFYLSHPSSFLVLCFFLVTPCLLLLIYSLYENDSRETMLTCARMFPDVQPWEVMEICRHCKLHSLESSSADFVFYVEQLIRWRTEVGNTRLVMFNIQHNNSSTRMYYPVAFI